MAPVHTPTRTHPIIQYLSPYQDSFRINGSTLANLNDQHLTQLGVNNNIIKRKLLIWIKEGLPEYERHLAESSDINKENIPPLQKKTTKERGNQKASSSQWKHNQTEEGMVVRSCDGSLAAYYVMKDKILKIGRSSINTIRSL